MDEENKVSINAGTVEELKSLKGIGDVKAQAIVDYRKQHGSFKDVNDLKNVKGIGDVTFKGIEDRITLLDKKQLLGKKIATKIAATKHVIAHKTKEEVKAIKDTIGLLPKNIKLAVLTGEVKALQAANNVKDTVVHIINETSLRAKKIKAKVHSGIGKIATKSKAALALLKHELSFEKNTLRAKQFMATIQKAGLYVENAALKRVNNVKDKVTNVKYKIEDKYLLAKFKIKTAISRKKNIIARKTAMQIALIKDSIKKRMDVIKQVLAVDDAKLQQSKEKIAALKEERSRLFNNLISNGEIALEGRSR